MWDSKSICFYPQAVALTAIGIAIEFLITSHPGELGGFIDDGTASNATKLIPGTNSTKIDGAVNATSAGNVTDAMAGHSSTGRKKCKNFLNSYFVDMEMNVHY